MGCQSSKPAMVAPERVLSKEKVYETAITKKTQPLEAIPVNNEKKSELENDDPKILSPFLYLKYKFHASTGSIEEICDIKKQQIFLVTEKSSSDSTLDHDNITHRELDALLTNENDIPEISSTDDDHIVESPLPLSYDEAFKFIQPSPSKNMHIKTIELVVSGSIHSGPHILSEACVFGTNSDAESTDTQDRSDSVVSRMSEKQRKMSQKRVFTKAATFNMRKPSTRKSSKHKIQANSATNSIGNVKGSFRIGTAAVSAATSGSSVESLASKMAKDQIQNAVKDLGLVSTPPSSSCASGIITNERSVSFSLVNTKQSNNRSLLIKELSMEDISHQEFTD